MRQSKIEKRRAEKRRETAFQALSFKELVDTPSGGQRFKDRCQLLWQEVALRALKRGDDQKRACEIANTAVGETWTERRDKARSGALDEVVYFINTEAVANAQRILGIATAPADV